MPEQSDGLSAAVAAVGAPATFAVNAVSTLAVIWAPLRRAAGPAEHFLSAAAPVFGRFDDVLQRSLAGIGPRTI
ncbi:hypothetical protein [Rhizobium laguerreae]|uniref:Uncharacterized protein n=1 Tax=Rhizobium laguerreae TaxID=1076926 RepID=A0A7Y2RAN1_9HYPH|nr:hypothetical protein [Rhizobium laguerreae]NNH67165.1 hypothetical protein [Rhizobium laguerreae]